MLETFARTSHQSTGFLQSAGSKPLLSKDVHGIPRNTSASDVTEGARKVCVFSTYRTWYLSFIIDAASAWYAVGTGRWMVSIAVLCVCSLMNTSWRRSRPVLRHQIFWSVKWIA